LRGKATTWSADMRPTSARFGEHPGVRCWSFRSAAGDDVASNCLQLFPSKDTQGDGKASSVSPRVEGLVRNRGKFGLGRHNVYEQTLREVRPGLSGIRHEDDLQALESGVVYTFIRSIRSLLFVMPPSPLTSVSLASLSVSNHGATAGPLILLSPWPLLSSCPVPKCPAEASPPPSGAH
jgi:hypothetical protein